MENRFGRVLATMAMISIMAMVNVSVAFGQVENYLINVIPDDTSTNTGHLLFYDKQVTTHYVGFKAADTISANVLWKLPAVDAVGCIQSDGSANLSIATCGFAPPVSITFNSVTTTIGSSVTNTGIEIEASSLTGNEVNIGVNFINSLANGVTGQTIWALADDGSNNGLLRLSNGSAAGGFDSNGAQIYATAADGKVRALTFLAGLSGGNQVNVGLDYVNALQGGTAGHTMWALGQSSNFGILRLSNGAGTGGWDGNGASIYLTASDGQTRSTTFTAGATTGNQTYMGADYVYSLKGGVPGQTSWALGDENSVTAKGLLRLSDGTGAGGINGNGEQIYATASSGTVTAMTGFVGRGGTFNVFQAVDGSGNPNGGFYGVQALAYQDHVYAQLGSTLGTVTGLQIYPDGTCTAPCNHLNAGIDFVNTLKNGTAGATIWALAQSSNKGILRLSDGSGAGGIDANGAQIYADANTAVVTAMTGYIARGANFNAFQAVDGSGNPNGGFYGIQALAYQDHVYAQLGSTVGTVTGLQIYPDTTGNHFNAGIDFVNTLKNGTAGATIWALAQASNYGILRLSDGSGVGGADGNGAQIYLTAVDGKLQATHNGTTGPQLILNNTSTTSGNTAVNMCQNGTCWYVFGTDGAGNNTHEFLLYDYLNGKYRIKVNVGGDLLLQPGGGNVYSGQLQATQNSITTTIGSSTASTGFQIQASTSCPVCSFSGNQVNAGVDFINALVNGVAGKTMWALGQSGNAGLLRLSNGSGSSGWDSNGAQIYGNGSTGLLDAVTVQLGNPTSGNKVNAGADYINALVNGTAGATMWALAQSGNAGLFRLSNGTGSGGWDSNGAQIYAYGLTGALDAVTFLVGSPSGGNKVNVGADYINSLVNGAAGQTLWAFGQSSNHGLLRVSNGTGSGGLDGNGAYVYANGTQLQVSSLNLTGASVFAPSGAGTLTGTITVRNGTNTGSCTITVSGGLVTATTC